MLILKGFSPLSSRVTRKPADGAADHLHYNVPIKQALQIFLVVMIRVKIQEEEIIKEENPALHDT